MKTLKSKLLASAAMLMLSVIMVTSASFAWFTISTKPEMTAITANVATNENLEIALDDGTGARPENDVSAPGDSGNTTWGNLVQLADYFKSNNANTITLKPAKVTVDDQEGVVVEAPVWGDDGRLSADFAETDAALITTTEGGGVYTYSDDNDFVYAIRVDFWLRTNVAGTIQLSAGGDRAAGEQGAGSTLTGDVLGGTTDVAAAEEMIKVAFLMDTDDAEWVIADIGTDGALTAEIGALGANEATKVSMYLYMDGEKITNADFIEATTGLALNVQFEHKGDDLVPMDIGAGSNDNSQPGNNENS